MTLFHKNMFFAFLFIIFITLLILPFVQSYTPPASYQQSYQQMSAIQEQYQKQMEETQKEISEQISEQIEKSIQEQINKSIDEQVSKQTAAVQSQVQQQVESQVNQTRELVKESVAATNAVPNSKPVQWLIILILSIIIITAAYLLVRFYKKRKTDMAFAAIRGELAVIMFTDMKGFSKHVGRHEQETLNQVWQYEKLMRQLIKNHGGTVIKTIGDSVMATFKSAIHAVNCAKAIQDELKAKPLKIRIGLHLGEVVHKEGDVYGNNVNIAARIESKAPPGGIAVSEDIYKQVHGRVQHSFKFIGAVELKNIKEPVKLYKVL